MTLREVFSHSAAFHHKCKHDTETGQLRPFLHEKHTKKSNAHQKSINKSVVIDHNYVGSYLCTQDGCESENCPRRFMTKLDLPPNTRNSRDD